MFCCFWYGNILSSMLYLIVNNTNLLIGDRYMRTDDFNFDLPEELIAQHPLFLSSASTFSFKL